MRASGTSFDPAPGFPRPVADTSDRVDERYRGPDRRALRAEWTRVPVSRSVLCVGIVAALWVLAALAFRTPSLTGSGLTGVIARVEVLTSALALVAGSAYALRSRVDGYAPAWWIGIALVVAGLPPISTSYSSDAFHALRAACAIVAALAMVVALRSPDVDTRLRPGRSALGALALVAALTTVFAIAGSRHATLETGVLFALAGIVAYLRARADAPGPWSMLFPFLCALAVADLLTGLVARDSAAYVAGAAVVRLVATLFPAVGGLRDLRAAAATQRTAAYGESLQREAAEMMQRATEERYAETLHEVRSTVVALEGGVSSLAPRDDAVTLSPVLARALAGEVKRLRSLVSDDSDRSAVRYCASDALEPVLTIARAGGVPVEWHVPRAIWVKGRAADLAQIVHALLTNATRHAPGSPIDVVAEQDGMHVVVRVADRGPGVPHNDRERIFSRGERGTTPAHGEGLGLYIARKTARAAGGDLWVEPRPGGGAVFSIALPVGDGVAARGDNRSVPALRVAARPGPSRTGRLSRRSLGYT